jgi:hypothetical protein
MTATTFNEDITYEIWKYVPYSSIQITSIVSKDFSSYYKKMTIHDKTLSRCKELGGIINYTSKIVEETCNQYGYNIPKFITPLNRYIQSDTSKIKKEFLEPCLIGDLVIILVHVVNNKYSEVLKKIKKTDYTTLKTNNSTLMFFVQLFTAPFAETFGRIYGENKKQIMKILCHLHLFRLANNLHRSNKSFRRILEEKKIELKNFINTKRFSLIYPKCFITGLNDIIDNLT